MGDQLYQYKVLQILSSILTENEEGEPILLTDDDHAAFIGALKGMQWDVGNQSWSKLDDDMLRENKVEAVSFLHRRRVWRRWISSRCMGGRNIQIVVDQDGDGLIELSSEVVNEIKEALKVTTTAVMKKPKNLE